MSTATHDDLDQARALLDGPPEGVEKLWSKVNDLAQHRRIDPELRRDLLRVAERVAPGLVGQITLELDYAVPAAVLEAHQDELIENRRSLGAFPRRESLEAPTPEEWIVADPRRLRALTFEIARFTTDDQRIAEPVLTLAEALGIDQRLAIDVTAAALRDVHRLAAVAR
jgi:hypothetical protein